ncbi:MAG: competence protein ComEC family protein [Flavobacteriales bacterium]|nr:competence protein ComEC family protein [Flavobacteriales bacterium]
MNPFPAIPFVRLCTGFVLGIILFNYFPGQATIAWIILGSILFTLLFTPQSYTALWNNSWETGLMIYLCLISLGYLNAHYQSPFKTIRDIKHMKIHVAELIENPVEKTNSFKAEAQLLYSQYEQDAQHGTTGIILYFEKNERIKQLKHGQKILFHAPVTIPYSPQNPRQFNYKKYLETKGIYYQAYINTNAFKVLPQPPRKNILYYIKEFRYEILRRIQSFGMPQEVTGIAAALLTGYKEILDSDTKASFSRVGAMHILAVSGLHVGIIYLMISGLLFFLKKNLWGRITALFITLFILWFYVILTGMSSSVLRAGIMFSLVSVGQTLSYKSNIYNTIFLSAFILLIVNPMNLFDVGFQLSYLAVLGIVFFFPAMNQWITSKYWIVNQIWALTCVSLSAQIATTPISLYHFGQFPTSFLIANLVVVPLAGIIIYIGIAAVIFTGIPLLGNITSAIFKFLITFMHQLIQVIEDIPYAYAENLTINAFQCLLLYAGLICFTCFFMNRYATWLVASLFIILVILITMTYRNWQVNHQQQLIIYAQNKKSWLEIMHGREVSYPSFDELTPMEYGLFIRANHQWKGIRKHHRIEKNKKNNPLFIQYPLIQAGNKRLWIIDDSLMLPINKIEIDYVWLKSKRFFNPDIILKSFSFQTILLDPCISEKNRKKMITTLDKLNIKYYDIAHSGAFIVNLN